RWYASARLGRSRLLGLTSYWGSVLQVFSLGATVVFAEVDPQTLTIDPADIEHRITPRTRAIVAVHLSSYPSEMDAIMGLAAKHGLKVIEDVSHAQGGEYKGRLLGTIGDVGAMSIMSGKSLVSGEGGFLVTAQEKIFNRALAFGHYARSRTLSDPGLARFAGYPLGGCKHRIHQLSSAVGRVQLRRYRGRLEEIRKAMYHFWDRLEGVRGLRPHLPPRDSGSVMGGFYSARGLYRADELKGLPLLRFCEAVNAEISAGGFQVRPGAGVPAMHLHPVLNEADIYGHGKPTRIAHSDRDLRQPAGSLPITESIEGRCYSIPWFKRYEPRVIDQYADAFRKVAENADGLQ
ncbi:MAG: DegT/DnrJ/EryC1/StrS family aminotransferase, partial [Gemmatimonadetes bacterium]|nr:DegT/DnrJ/EryC1/StrS family aminotransferase [Gemmatimonadota bacterium]